MDEQTKAIIEGVSAAVNKQVDEKLGQAFHKIDATIEERLQKHTNAMLSDYGEIRKQLGRLNEHVFGDSNPPPPPDNEPSPKPLVKRISEIELENDEVKGHVINLKGEVSTVKEQNAKQLELLDKLVSMASGVLTNPLFKKVAAAAAVAALTWFGLTQARLEAKAAKLEEDLSHIGVQKK